MKTFLLLVALVGIASAVNLRVGSQLSSEEQICEQARSHISFLRSQLSDCSGKYQSRKCAVIRSALALLEENKETSDELQDRYQEASDSRETTGGELDSKSNNLTTKQNNNNSGLAADAKNSDSVREEGNLGGTRADGESVYDASHGGVIHTEKVSKRMSIVARINKHMENVRNILVEFKKEHVDKCTEANKRLAARVVNQQEVQEDAFNQLAEANEERADVAMELDEVEEKTVKQAKKGELYEKQLNNLIGNICDGITWLEAYHESVEVRAEYFAAVQRYDAKVTQMKETVTKLTELFDGGLQKCEELVAKTLNIQEHNIEEGDKDGVIKHLCKLHAKSFEGHKEFVETHFGTEKHRGWIEPRFPNANDAIKNWLKDPTGTTPDFDKHGENGGPTTAADYLKEFVAADKDHFRTFDIEKRCPGTPRPQLPSNKDTTPAVEDVVSGDDDSVPTATTTEGDSGAINELKGEEAILDGDM